MWITFRLVHFDWCQDGGEFLAVLKSNPGKYRYGTDGVGGTMHLAAERIFRDASQCGPLTRGEQRHGHPAARVRLPGIRYCSIMPCSWPS
jgi:hypothetical protein